MLVALVMGWRLLPSQDSAFAKASLNWLSLILIATSLASFLTGISRGLRAGWTSLYVYGLFLTSMYFLPVFAQTVLGYTAFKAGLLLMLNALSMSPIFLIGGRLAQ